MEIGLRALALIIDVVLCLGYLPVLIFVVTLILDKASGGIGLLLFPILFPLLVIVWPFLFLALPTGIWGMTPGKLICRLSVADHRGNPPGVWRALGREVLKFLALGSGLGLLLTIFQILTEGTTWYDQLCGTRVTFSPYIRLTKTQRNWRKYMRDR